ncbi:unnamed protein product [Camellia sinensis]
MIFEVDFSFFVIDNGVDFSFCVTCLSMISFVLRVWRPALFFFTVLSFVLCFFHLFCTFHFSTLCFVFQRKLYVHIPEKIVCLYSREISLHSDLSPIMHNHTEKIISL